jgi:NTP pyrophosphatase (non-canonical NTP hydrolase)
MDISQLTTEMNRFVSAKGWYAENSPRPQTARNLAISLVLEAAEVLELYQWGESAVSNQELSGELADVALYLLQIASITGIDLEAAIMEKLKKNFQRSWDGAGTERKKIK